MAVIENPEVGHRDQYGDYIQRVTDDWVVVISPMLFNHRICLAEREKYGEFYVAGWCYDDFTSALLAANVWHPDESPAPVGFKREAFAPKERSSSHG